MPGRPLAAFWLVFLLAAAESQAGPLESGGAQLDQRGDVVESLAGWRAVTGLRLEQWIAPAADHLRVDVRLRLPEMGLGEHLSIETFNWERLDLGEDRAEGDWKSGTVYHLLGARYRREAGSHALSIGAHAMSWSGHGRLLTPWLGMRWGQADGPSIAAELHLLGLGPMGGELYSPLDDADLMLAIEGPRLGVCQIGARGRARDVRHPDRHQREQMISVGAEFQWGLRRMFLGVGVQHEVRRASDGGGAPAADRMDPAAAGRTESTAVMVHLDAETPLPRSLVSL